MVPACDIVLRALRAEGLYTQSRLALLEQLPANPVGVEQRRLGEAFAFSARHLPIDSFNRVVGLTDDHADAVPELIRWFEDRSIQGRFEVVPGVDSPAVTKTLAHHGYSPSRFHALLYGEARPAPAPAADITVEGVDAATLETFLDTYAAGWGIPEPEGFKRNVRGWLGRPGWTLYLGRYRNEAAGEAILFMDGATGYCADSSVNPAYRGRGVHQALLRRRIADAAASGADLICAEADFLSTSHRNMIRAGLSLLTIKSAWTRSPS